MTAQLLYVYYITCSKSTAWRGAVLVLTLRCVKVQEEEEEKVLRMREEKEVLRVWEECSIYLLLLVQKYKY